MADVYIYELDDEEDEGDQEWNHRTLQLNDPTLQGSESLAHVSIPCAVCKSPIAVDFMDMGIYVLGTLEMLAEDGRRWFHGRPERNIPFATCPVCGSGQTLGVYRDAELP